MDDEKVRGSRKPGQSIGVRLRQLHAWNGWVVVLLAVTGILLAIPALRSDLLGMPIRSWLKQGHLMLGIVSVLVLLAYIPLMGRHRKQLRSKTGQQFNLGLVLLLLAGWTVSGIALMLVHNLPKPISSAALIVHDAWTWIGVPWIIYHMISRSRWVKQRSMSQPLVPYSPGAAEDGGPGTLHPAAANLFWTRRKTLRVIAGAGIAAIAGPAFYRWLKTTTDTGGTNLERFTAGGDPNRLLPAPEPLSESLTPIGGGARGNFRIYTVTRMPVLTNDNWTLVVDGLVERPSRLDWESFVKLPRTVQVSDFHCVTGWSVYACTWEGLSLAQLLDAAEVKPEGSSVKFYSSDGVYTDALTLEQARMSDVMVAVMLDGKPIPRDLGGPVRLIVPKMFAYKSVKWLSRIEVIQGGHIGYWEERGYDNDAWVPGLEPDKKRSV